MPHPRPAEVPPLSVGFVLLHRFTLLPFAALVDCLAVVKRNSGTLRHA
ncbi:hypothetical protein [Billgrantia aerodenitrificans]|uniref:Uncharacterized protein n=1 Tax=Billgrantia aerodenitrificans TaxID=2733483 RepID=A0ABS9AN54_9GAMM|nr:hypothetical protein [Halomonas aerodenitrificans]MCE8023194.1 hypothetical protein [Halomonas aerodenitrificans]